MFNFDTDTLALQLLPPPLRSLRHSAWLGVLLAPLAWLKGQFFAFRAANTREMSYNGQTMMLEAALNDYLPAANGLIVVVNLSDNLPITFDYGQVANAAEWLVLASESRTEYDHTMAYYLTQNSFEVRLPIIGGVQPVSSAQATPYIEHYRPVARPYLITTYTP